LRGRSPKQSPGAMLQGPCSCGITRMLDGGRGDCFASLAMTDSRFFYFLRGCQR
jgi:hypothetical protein